jgi:hypothetical protein
LVLAIEAFLLGLDLDGFSQEIDIVVFSTSDVVLVLFGEELDFVEDFGQLLLERGEDVFEQLVVELLLLGFLKV